MVTATWRHTLLPSSGDKEKILLLSYLPDIPLPGSGSNDSDEGLTPAGDNKSRKGLNYFPQTPMPAEPEGYLKVGKYDHY